MSYPVDLRYALHPVLPVKLGYRQLLRLVNPPLAELLRKTDPFTLMSARNRTTLYREGLRVLEQGTPGDFIEIGVHRGGSAAVLAELIKDDQDRLLHLFDRWGDLPEPTDEDGFRQQQYARAAIGDKLLELKNNPPIVSTRRVIEEVVRFPRERLRYYQGWYETAFDDYSGETIAFASIDCDYYESVKLTLGFVESHASVGTVMVLDDYGTWPGTRRALEEWLTTTRLRTRLLTLSTGPAIVRVTGID